MRVLAGDIGGTKTSLGWVDATPEGPRLDTVESFPSRGTASLESLVDAFLAKHPSPLSAACFGVAGPIADGRCVATNLPWVVDAQVLARQLRLPQPQVGLINDLESAAWGIPTLPAAELVTLNAGAPATGHAAVVAAGTGLGMAGLYWTGTEHVPMASEGGHVDFAARSALEFALFEYLRDKLGKRVSYERLLSGPGLVNLYSFLRDTGRAEEPPWLAEALAGQDHPAAVISAHALAGKSALCEQALTMFVQIFGAVAGNVALQYVARAGVYLAGGIAPKILPKLQGRDFLDAYLDKGRLSPLVAATPVRVVTHPHVALLGAARYALTRRLK